MTDRLKNGNYVRINRESLLAGRIPIDFNIYTLRTGDDSPILLLGRGSSAAETREILSRKRPAPLYVDRREYRRFQKLAEASISAIIHDQRLPLTAKSSIVYGCAQEVMRDVLENPRSGENIQRAKEMTEEIIALALHNYASIPIMLRLSARDYYTFSHCVNVAVFAVGFWLMIGSGEEEDLRSCAIGCMLHDVGKSEIDLRILKKPGRLTEPEFEEIKTHPEKGYHLMQGYVNDAALDIILHHHEKANGSGYPHGLREDEIADCVKIAAIADVYDALTTERPYGHAQPPFQALQVMKEEMSGHFARQEFIDFIRFLGGGPKQGSPPGA